VRSRTMAFAPPNNFIELPPSGFAFRLRDPIV
jgi:hypothetical protein